MTSREISCCYLSARVFYICNYITFVKGIGQKSWPRVDIFCIQNGEDKLARDGELSESNSITHGAPNERQGRVINRASKKLEGEPGLLFRVEHKEKRPFYSILSIRRFWSCENILS